eukprot:9878293-Lingulodinium_polyedra.AAC.1
MVYLAFCCFARHGEAPASRPGAAGLERVSEGTKARWAEDDWAQAPYQYDEGNMVRLVGGRLRRLTAAEEEAISGMPRDLRLPVAGSELPSGE